MIAEYLADDFLARSPDELSLAKGDRIELIERDDDFGDGWFLGRHMANGNTGLFPEGSRSNTSRVTIILTTHSLHDSSSQRKLCAFTAAPFPSRGRCSKLESSPSGCDPSSGSYQTSSK